MTKETPTDRWTAIGTKRNNQKKTSDEIWDYIFPGTTDNFLFHWLK